MLLTLFLFCIQPVFRQRSIIVLMKILVIEDELIIANSLKKGLQQERYVVDVALTGTEGYDLALNEKYDLILLDLMLPEMDGITICQELRKNKITTPILMLTAKGQTHDKVTGLDIGADDYLTKPFAFDELLARIRALIRRPVQLEANELVVGDLKLNPQLFTLSRNGQTIHLSQKEFMLMEYLMRHPNQILSKQHLIDHLWAFEADILPNTIEVFIKNLRTKVDHPFKDQPEVIETVRGFGYRLKK
jgi:two-component system, OmpR family, response regulator